MIDVCLITVVSPQPNSSMADSFIAQPPLGIAYIASVLIKNGYSVELIDMNLRSMSIQYLEKVIKIKKPRIVGLSALTESSNNAIRLSHLIKKIDKNIFIVLGGSHFSFLDRDVLNHSTIDFVVRNEGEYTFLELCNTIFKNKNNYENILGLTYKNNDTIIRNRPRPLIKDLDSLPFPSRNLYFLEEYNIPAGIITSRGCPNQCIFCSAGAFSGGRYRMRSAENVFEEIKMLYDYGYNFIFFQDDTLTVDINRLNRILDLIIVNKLKIAWLCESRVDIEDKEIFKKMSEAGCIGLQFGIESGSQEILDKVNKNITLDEIMESLSAAVKYNLTPICSFMIGHWLDTPQTIDDSISFAIKVQKEFLCQSLFSISTPLPGTRLYNKIEEYGCKLISDNFDRYDMITPVMETKYLNANQIRWYFFKAVNELSKNTPKELISLLTLKKSLPEKLKSVYNYDDTLI
ncbi:MAG: radical SAM protein [Ignavibacteria bacterium]|nr:radical SAM protein [Ignavibacteria bacterium]